MGLLNIFLLCRTQFVCWIQDNAREYNYEKNNNNDNNCENDNDNYDDYDGNNDNNDDNDDDLALVVE